MVIITTYQHFVSWHQSNCDTLQFDINQTSVWHACVSSVFILNFDDEVVGRFSCACSQNILANSHEVNHLSVKSFVVRISVATAITLLFWKKRQWKKKTILEIPPCTYLKISANKYFDNYISFIPKLLSQTTYLFRNISQRNLLYTYTSMFFLSLSKFHHFDNL